MNKYEIILIGAGGHAASCIDVIEAQGAYRVGGFVAKDIVFNRTVQKYIHIGSDLDIPRLRSSYLYALVAVGQIKSPNARIKLYDQLLELGYELPSIASPSAYISPHAKIGIGTIIMHGAVINAGAVIGNNCIINTLATIDHDTVVGDHSHISTGAILNGGVIVGSGSFVGSGSVVMQDIKIGSRSVIGMGLAVREDIPDEAFFLGLHRYDH
jgi:sugar O-acyltransferase (sialic acid O-acetyltransferase NeuD family)